MPISDNIKKLTDLALTDRILTYKERLVIEEEALKEGVSKQDIKAYLDDALHERLKTYSKEQLKRCPHCGAQIPLISDVCLFCGESLENVSIAAEQHNIKTCPDCGAPFPLVSNVCTHCGHILHEQLDSELNAKLLIENIKDSISDLKETPQPTFWQVLWYRKNIWLFLISTILLIRLLQYMYRYVYSGYTLLWLFLGSMALWILSIVLTMKSKRKDPPSKIADDKFFAALHRKEMYENQISTIYGDNSEARAVLQQYAALTDNIKTERRGRQIKLILVFCAFLGANLFTLIDTYSNKDVFKSDVQKYSHVYGLWDKKFTVQPADTNFFSEYILMDGEADLSIGVDFANYINSIWKDEVEYHLTVSNVHLKSSGKEFELHDNQAIAIALYDEDCNQVGALFDPIIIYVHGDDAYMDVFKEKLKRGKGECYAEFISQKATLPADEANVKLLTDMAQRAKWYSIYLYTKPLDDDY
ncbi:MAG: zinc ribbon domain-containing protein [Bacteroidales bacterium]|nr:zinc ribbon domain-containing protein [Bacteroidales bacterium]